MIGVALSSFKIPVCLVEDFCGIHSAKWDANYDYSIPAAVTDLYAGDSSRHGCFQDVNVCSSFSFVKKKEVKYISPVLMDLLRNGG
jgi:hypothetical protein